MLFTDGRLSLGGSTIPLFYLSSIVSVLYIQTISFWLFINEKYYTCFTLLALTTYFHPASGLFFIMTLMLALLVRIFNERKFGIFVKSGIIGLLIFIPNAVLISKNLSPLRDSVEFFHLFYLLKGGHAFPQDYWFGYLFTFETLIILYFLYKSKKVLIQHLSLVFSLLGIILFFVLVWLVNLFYVQNLQFFYLYLAMRSAYILKPLLSLFLGCAIFAYARDSSLVSKLNIVLILTAAFISNQAWSGVPLAFVIFFELLRKFYSDLDARWYKRVADIFNRVNKRRLIIAVSTISAVLVFWVFGNKYNGKWFKVWNLLNGKNEFNYSFDVSKNYGFKNSNPDFSSLIDWSKGFKGKMFITQPTDCSMNALRFLTKNSIYINTCDMAQLSYVPDSYLLGYERLKKIGFVIKERGVFDESQYYKMNLSDYKSLNEADYIVFDKNHPAFQSKNEKPVFEDRRYVVFKLR